MVKFKSLKQFEDMSGEQKVPAIIVNAVIGDLYAIDKNIDPDYCDLENADLYGPLVVVMSKEEFDNIDKLIPSISKDNYEYKEVIAVTEFGYIMRYLYLFCNGESGIIIYVNKIFKDCKQKFTNQIYTTANFYNSVPHEIAPLLKKVIEISRLELNDKLDYLQVFELTTIGEGDLKILVIKHRQEEPGYSRVFYFPGFECTDCKIFWISDEDEEGNEYSTLMLSEDY